MELKVVLIISFFIISVLGTVLHFTHNWFKRGILLHVFSAVNESTWEHMKLLVFPTIIVMIFQYILLKDIYPNLFLSLFVLYMVEVLTIPILFEPLRLIFKKVHLAITIIIFYIAILLGLYSQYIILHNGISFLNEYISLILIVVSTIKFGVFTYIPPKIFIFKDPVTGRYGDVGRHN
jgi:hypothetical protein